MSTCSSYQRKWKQLCFQYVFLKQQLDFSSGWTQGNTVWRLGNASYNQNESPHDQWDNMSGFLSEWPRRLSQSLKLHKIVNRLKRGSELSEASQSVISNNTSHTAVLQPGVNLCLRVLVESECTCVWLELCIDMSACARGHALCFCGCCWSPQSPCGLCVMHLFRFLSSRKSGCVCVNAWVGSWYCNHTLMCVCGGVCLYWTSHVTDSRFDCGDLLCRFVWAVVLQRCSTAQKICVDILRWSP